MFARPALIATLTALTALGAAQPALAAEADDRFYVSPLLGMVIADSARTLDDPIGGNLLFGKPLTDRLNLELSAWLASADADDGSTSTDMAAYGVNLLFFPQRDSSPLFGLLGVSHGDVGDHPASGGPTDYASTLVDVGVGGLWPVFGDRMRLRAQAAYRFDAHFDTTLGRGQRDGFNEPVLALGLQIALGSRDTRPASRSQGPAVVAPVQAHASPSAPPQAEGQTTDASDTAIVLRGVRFAVDSAELTPTAKEILDRVAVSLRRAPGTRFELIGHTDSTASAAYNQALSERRASAVRDHLAGLGIAASRMETRGEGENQPVASNDTELGRALNRRVEIELLD